MKRLVVFCDGTWNRADKPAVTNVYKLKEAVDDGPDQAVRQLVLYEEGVGTRGLDRLPGGAFGLGVSRRVRNAYRWIASNYEPGDEVFLFGFSRGAFTARSIAGLVRNVGILRPEHVDRVPSAYCLYRSLRGSKAPGQKKAEEFRTKYSYPESPIKFVGVWDTVGSLGIPFYFPVVSRLWTFHDTTLSNDVQNAYHALSIDERRRPYTPTLWTEKVPRDPATARPPDQPVEQRWFAGVHSDVGGGYPDPALSEVPLLWIAKQAEDCGLVLKPDHLVRSQGRIPESMRRTAIQVAPDACAGRHESMTWPYRFAIPHHRRPDRAVARRLRVSQTGPAIGVSVDESVYRRWAADPAYGPRGLAQWCAQHPDEWASLGALVADRPKSAAPPKRPSNLWSRLRTGDRHAH